MDQEKARIFMFSLAKIVHNLGAFPPRKIITTNVSTYDYAVVKTWYVRLKLNFYKFFFLFLFLKTGKTEWRQYEDLNGHRRYILYIIFSLSLVLIGTVLMILFLPAVTSFPLSTTRHLPVLLITKHSIKSPQFSLSLVSVTSIRFVGSRHLYDQASQFWVIGLFIGLNRHVIQPSTNHVLFRVYSVISCAVFFVPCKIRNEH